MPHQNSPIPQPYEWSWKDAAIGGDLVIAIVLNRYSSVMPFGWIITSVILAILLVGVWLWRVVSHGRFGVYIRGNPLTCLVIFFLLGWVVIQGILGLESKLHASNQGSISPTTSGSHSGVSSELSIHPKVSPSKPVTKSSVAKADPPKKLRVETPLSPSPVPPPPAVTVNADNNSGNIAGINNGQMIVNQVGVGVPQILWKPTDPDNDPNGGIDQNGMPTPIHPRAGVLVKIDRLWPKAKFVVYCDRPCAGIKWSGVLGMSHSSFASIVEKPNLAIFYFDIPNPFPSDTLVKLTVESIDDKPINVINVGPGMGKLPGED